METTRGHLTKLRQQLQPNDKKIDRSTRYGNEFQIEKPHPDTGLPMTRDDVCDLFEERQLPSMDVEPLRGKRLLCWCKPNERCHGDSIIKKLDETKHMIGHNSNALAPLVKKAQNGLAQVKKGEETTLEGWLEYGAALNEGRELFPKGDNKRFSEWLFSSQLANCSKDDRLAAMWAAANIDEFHQTKEDNPKVRTIRGLHAKWKEAQEKKGKDDENGTATTKKPKLDINDRRKVGKLLKVFQDPATPTHIREAVGIKLNGYEEAHGKHFKDYVGDLNDSVVEDRDDDKEPEVDREYVAEKMVETVLRNLDKEPAKDYLTLVFLDAYKNDSVLMREFNNLIREVKIW